MEQKELTCIGCPMGCTVTVLVENGRVDNISGNHCKIGEEYARSEVTNPVRTLTSTIAVVPSSFPGRGRISVKTSHPIPQNLIGSAMREINQTSVKAPIHLGDVLIHRVAGTDADIVATAELL